MAPCNCPTKPLPRRAAAWSGCGGCVSRRKLFRRLPGIRCLDRSHRPGVLPGGCAGAASRLPEKPASRGLSGSDRRRPPRAPDSPEPQRTSRPRRGLCIDPPHALELANVERVQADQFPGLAGLDVRRLATLSGEQLPGRYTLGSRGPPPGHCGLRTPPGAPSGSADRIGPASGRRAGGHLSAAVFGQTKLESQLQRPPGGPGDGQGQDGPFGLNAQQWRPPRASPRAPRV
jgi:hypothetical protein